MLHCNIIVCSEGVDIKKTSLFKECVIYCYWYFLGKRFRFQPFVCYRCHDVLTMSDDIINITILNIRGVDCCCVVVGISNNEVIECWKMLFEWTKWIIITNHFYFV